MAGKARCVTCGKDKAVMKCGGCSKDFCFNHMTDHRQELSRQLDEIENTRDLFRQSLTEQMSTPQKHALLRQIDQWEQESIYKIREAAEEERQLLMHHTEKYFNEIEIKLNKLTAQLRESREENDFIETDLRTWERQLKSLEEELRKPSNITVKQDSTPLVTKISVSPSSKI